MADPFQPVHQGQALELSARSFNGTLKAGQDFSRRKFGDVQRRGRIQPARRMTADIVRLLRPGNRRTTQTDRTNVERKKLLDGSDIFEFFGRAAHEISHELHRHSHLCRKADEPCGAASGIVESLQPAGDGTASVVRYPRSPRRMIVRRSVPSPTSSRAFLASTWKSSRLPSTPRSSADTDVRPNEYV